MKVTINFQITKGDTIMSEIYEEVMEQETSMEPVGEVIEGVLEEDETTKSGGLKLAALVIGGVAAVAGLAAVGYKRLKNRKACQTNKPKTKWKLVRVPVDCEEYEDYVEDSEVTDDDYSEE